MRRPFRALLVTSLVASVLAIPSAALAPKAASAATVPGGFTDALVATVSSPTAVEQLDASRVVVLEKDGRVRVIKNGSLLPAPALTRSVCSSGEMGFLGFAVDPAFGTNHFVYLYWTRPKGTKCVNRVSRFTMTGDTINPTSEVVLLDNIAGTETESFGNHNGGDLEIPSDGYLYVSVGDSGSDPRNNSGSSGANDAAQDASLLNGKIVRITRAGAPVPGNPFYNAAGATNCAKLGVSASPAARCREIFAAGLRNPYRMAFDTNTSTTRFFINDVGQSAREEVDLGRLGANYGWPCREGNIAGTYTGSVCTHAFTGPITDYGRSVGQFITGGAFVPNGLWPTAYDGGYLFGDGGSGKIWLRTAAGTINYGAPFATTGGVVSHLAFVLEAAGASLYYVLNDSGQVRKITPSLVRSPVVAGLAFQPIRTARVYDTRSNIGGAGVGPMRANTTRQVVLGAPGKAAALVNVALAGASSGGLVQAWRPRTSRPASSLLSLPGPGAAVANSVIVPLDFNGRAVFASSAGGHLIIDVAGYFDEAPSVTGGRFGAVAPARLMDSRLPANAITNPISRVGDHLEVQVTGRAGVPASGAGSVALALTIIGSSGGSVTAYPTGQPRPAVASLSVGSGDKRSIMAIVRIGTGGRISLYGAGLAGVVADVAGWFTANAPTGGLLTIVPPSRRVDTRINLGFGPIPAGVSRTVTLAGLPSTTRAIVQNLTVLGTTGNGWLTASPNAGPVPPTSNLNWLATNQSRAVLAVTQLPASHSARYSAFIGSTGLVVDLNGYFT
jgi:glucose/arabinose dehydrogenase